MCAASALRHLVTVALCAGFLPTNQSSVSGFASTLRSLASKQPLAGQHNALKECLPLQEQHTWGFSVVSVTQGQSHY